MSTMNINVHSAVPIAQILKHPDIFTSWLEVVGGLLSPAFVTCASGLAFVLGGTGAALRCWIMCQAFCLAFMRLFGLFGNLPSRIASPVSVKGLSFQGIASSAAGEGGVSAAC